MNKYVLWGVPTNRNNGAEEYIEAFGEDGLCRILHGLTRNEYGDWTLEMAEGSDDLRAWQIDKNEKQLISSREGGFFE